MAGRLRQPLSYVAADKRLQDQHDYLDEVRGGEEEGEGGMGRIGMTTWIMFAE